MSQAPQQFPTQSPEGMSVQQQEEQQRQRNVERQRQIVERQRQIEWQKQQGKAQRRQAFIERRDPLGRTEPPHQISYGLQPSPPVKSGYYYDPTGQFYKNVGYNLGEAILALKGEQPASQTPLETQTYYTTHHDLASELFYSSEGINYPQYAGKYAPFDVPAGYKIKSVTEVTGLGLVEIAPDILKIGDVKELLIIFEPTAETILRATHLQGTIKETTTQPLSRWSDLKDFGQDIANLKANAGTSSLARDILALQTQIPVAPPHQRYVYGFGSPTSGLVMGAYAVAAFERLYNPYAPSLVEGLMSGKQALVGTLVGEAALMVIGGKVASWMVEGTPSPVRFKGSRPESWLIRHSDWYAKRAAKSVTSGIVDLPDAAFIKSGGLSTIPEDWAKPMPSGYLGGFEENLASPTKLGLDTKPLAFWKNPTPYTDSIFGLPESDIPSDYLAGFTKATAKISFWKEEFSSIGMKERQFAAKYILTEGEELPTNIRGIMAEQVGWKMGFAPKTAILDPFLLSPEEIPITSKLFVHPELPFIPAAQLIKSSSFLPSIVGASALFGLGLTPKAMAVSKPTFESLPKLAQIARPSIGVMPKLKLGNIVGNVPASMSKAFSVASVGTKLSSAQVSVQEAKQVQSLAQIQKQIQRLTGQFKTPTLQRHVTPFTFPSEEPTKGKHKKRGRKAFMLEMGIGEFYYPEPPTLEQIFGKPSKRRKKK